MKLRCKLHIRNANGATNAEIFRNIKKEAQSRMKDIQRMCSKFKRGTVKFTYGDFDELESESFKTDWIMYRRALTEVFDCEIETLSIDYDSTLRPRVIQAELYLEGE